ncbi:unnamed protein product [Rotaria sordida]|uniref:CHHC U11-48K-type domain-containing protein n=1 Tax=Rotaria sordida TaxID=392033 RepID=A0A819BX21_9BILA|nr:unnamed protein product [Rotaria sordida]
MSNLYLCPDDFWRCPIDLNHQVLAKRFQYHIRRCMIANPHIRRVRCVFNANHLTTPNDLLAHMSTCPDAINRSTVLIGLSDIPPGRPWVDTCRRSSSPNDWQMFHDVNATEDWDDDIRERRARRAASSEQMMISSSIQFVFSIVLFFIFSTIDVLSRILPSSSPSLTSQRLHEKQQKDVEDVNQKTTVDSYTPVTVIKQAHVFKEHDNDGLIHPVETDELTKNLMKIRTLQLIGGAGRGTCCLLRTVSPVLGYSPSKLP